MKKDDNGAKKMIEQAILLSIQPQHAVKILNGDKTLELRKSVPKDFVGWVYIYVTKGIKDILYKYKDKYYTQHYLTFTDSVEILNSKVVAKFWFDEYETIKERFNGDEYIIEKLDELCLSDYEVKEYLGNKKGYAWHIKKLEIFAEPMELRDFSIFKRETISCGMDCPPYTDWVEYRVRKAPQSWQYVYKEEIK